MDINRMDPRSNDRLWALKKLSNEGQYLHNQSQEKYRVVKKSSIGKSLDGYKPCAVIQGGTYPLT